MSFTGFVLAFAGAMAAKVRPAPRRAAFLFKDELDEAYLLKDELEASRWALETVRGELAATRDELGRVRRDRDGLRAEIERLWRDRPAGPHALMLAHYQGQQNFDEQARQLAAVQQALNPFFNLNQQQGLAQAAYHDCTCVPGRAAAFERD